MTDSTRPAGTPGQTVGPFFGFALPFPRDHELVAPGTEGARRLHGRVLDGAGDGVPDALIEIRVPTSTGTITSAAGSWHRDGWSSTGWGRCATDGAGHYSFTTPLPEDVEPAMFVAVVVFARGLVDRLATRCYLPGPGGETPVDPWLSALPGDRRATVVAHRDGPASYRFDLRLQPSADGPETVYLDHRSTYLDHRSTS